MLMQPVPQTTISKSTANKASTHKAIKAVRMPLPSHASQTVKATCINMRRRCCNPFALGPLCPKSAQNPTAWPHCFVTLYKTRHTKRFSGIRKMLMIVDRSSSGTYCALIAIMEGQKMPMHASKPQNANSCTLPVTDRPPVPLSASDDPPEVYNQNRSTAHLNLVGTATKQEGNSYAPNPGRGRPKTSP